VNWADSVEQATTVLRRVAPWSNRGDTGEQVIPVRRYAAPSSGTAAQAEDPAGRRSRRHSARQPRQSGPVEQESARPGSGLASRRHRAGSPLRSGEQEAPTPAFGEQTVVIPHHSAAPSATAEPKAPARRRSQAGRSRSPKRGPARPTSLRRRLLGTPRRPALPLLASLSIGLVLAVVLGPFHAPTLKAPPATAALVATSDQLTGLALGDDRLPDCSAVVGGLTPRQKLAQRLMVGVAGTAPAAAAQLVESTQVGGIFVGGNANALLTRQAMRGVQAVSRLPLAVAVDDEGGRVQRVEALDGNLLSARALAASQKPAGVQQIARERGRALAARGITMNLAPDVDVSDQPDNAVIGDRSFSNDAATVAAYAAAYAQGEHEAGVFTVLKHFPGHGHADGDSHLQQVTTPPLDQLKTNDLVPYADLLKPGGPLADMTKTGVMVGHLDVPGLTDDAPSSLTPATYKLLRDTYHFDGLAITDDLGAMKAITDVASLPDAVEAALGAGADMALWTSNDPVPPVLDDLEKALASGTLDAAANDTAVQRVLAAKGICSRH
jgi:beta-N-acetylhexosaminidase